MKARAPPPPSQPLAASQIQSEQKSLSELGVIPDQSLVTMKENLINRTVDFTVVLPSGVEQKNNVHGSKAVMDLLVDLCSRYRLNPAHHTLELKACGMEPLSYKPNTLVGALDVQTVLLKEKVPEGKTKRPPPRIPEKSMRLVVNYLKTHKAVVRVSPEVPLHSIIPAICEKCEVSPEHVVLLRDNITGEELELTKSLDELGIKELYAWDRKREPYVIETIRPARVAWQEDPRFQDSSSEEDDEPEASESENCKEMFQSLPQVKTSRFFFFSKDDERLRDGPKLFCRSSNLNEEKDNWENRRRLLLEECWKKHKDARRKVKAKQ